MHKIFLVGATLLAGLVVASCDRVSTPAEAPAPAFSGDLPIGGAKPKE